MDQARMQTDVTRRWLNATKLLGGTKEASGTALLTVNNNTSVSVFFPKLTKAALRLGVPHR